MELSEEAMNIIQQAVTYACVRGFEYVTPEMILIELIQNEVFSEAFTSCEGDVQMLLDDLINYIETYVDKSEKTEPKLSEGVQYMLNCAGHSAFNSSNRRIDVRHIVHAIWQLKDSYAVYYMEHQGVTESGLLYEMACLEEETAGAAASAGSQKQSSDTGREKPASEPAYAGTVSAVPEKGDSPIRLFAPCLNDIADHMNPLIGRVEELDRTIQILCRKDKNNPLHIGEPGVGKTAITYGLACMINEGRVPEPLRGAKIFSLDLGGLLAGTQYRGDFEKRFKKVLGEIGKEDKPIIYIDEIHNLSGAGAVGEGSFDASNLLKPYLADGKIRFIGATTFEEYKKHFEKNKSLVRRFQNVEIREPNESEAVNILEGLKARYEKYHKVKYAKGVLEYAVRMSAKYINERFLPDKAIDLIDEAGAYRRLHPLDKKTQSVDKEVINTVLTSICRVTVEAVKTDDNSGLAGLETGMKKKIFGQDEAISQVVNAVKLSKAGLLEDNKPLASLLFVGPTGVGKTEIAKTLASELGLRLIRFDMSEYGEKHAVAKLIGSPAGYVGYEEGGLLTEAVRKNPSAVLLLDEIEKAHADIFGILLQIMDYATLTDNQGRKADFRNVIVIMTSNAGANNLGKSGIGFNGEAQNTGALLEAVKQIFQPEFRNRLNKIVVFNSMDETMGRQVVDKKLYELGEMLAARNIELIVEEEARTLIGQKGINREFGAREVDRVLRNEVKPLFVDEILFGKLKKGGRLKLSVKGEKFIMTASRK